MAMNTTWLLLTSSLLMTCFLFRPTCGDVRHAPISSRYRPNILFILMDDMGYSDLGVHDSNMHTPTLDKLYNEGFRLNYSYTDPVGSSTRASLMSGKFSFKMGLQDGAINKYPSAHVPLTHRLLSEALKRHNYMTHLIGKWEQGFCNVAMTPLKRGFQSFFGQYTSKTDPSTMKTEEGFLDFRSNQNVMTDARFQNLYSTEVWSKRAVKEINRHKKKFPNREHPFFIMVSMTAIQSPNVVPEKYVRKCRKGVFTSDERKKKCGMMAAVDKTVFRIMRALEKTEQDHDTVVFFTSDNGGDAQQGSSNWPLRGSMGSVWEGGIRVPSFIWSESTTLLPVQNHTFSGFFHAVDWYPTLLGFARTNGRRSWGSRIMPPMDGENQWRVIKRGTRKSFREEFAYLVEEDGKKVAYIRQGDYNMVVNEEASPGWYSPPFGFNATDLEEPKLNWKRKPFLLFNIRKDPSESRDLSRSKVPVNAEARDSLLLL